MPEPSRSDLLEMIASLETDLSRMKVMVCSLVPEKQWYTCREFAEKKGLKPKTVSNYVRQGRYSRIRTNARGHHEIHRSEL